MPVYSEKVMDHFMHPRNVGEMEDPSCTGTVGNAKCGDIMKIYLKIEDGIIKESQPLIDSPVAGYDEAGLAVASDD